MSLVPSALVAWSLLVGGHPEAVLLDGESLYASNMGLNMAPFKDKDGTITKIDLDGRIDTSFRVPAGALDSPMALARTSKGLAVLDIDRVVMIDPSSGAVGNQFSLAPVGGALLNDIALLDDHTVLITETLNKKLFRLDVRTGGIDEISLPFAPVFLNGIAYDRGSKILYLVQNLELTTNPQNAEIVALDLSEGDPRVLYRKFLGYFFDGVQVLDGKVYVSEWVLNGKGRLTEFHPGKSDARKQWTVNVNGFARFAIARQGPGVRVFAPHLVTGTIQAIDLRH